MFVLQLGVAATLMLATKSVFSAWPKVLFTSNSFTKTIHELTAEQEVQESPQVVLGVDEQTQNGARVRVKIVSSLPNVKSISILVENNPVPLISQFFLQGETKADIQMNLKMQESSNILVLVEADGKFYKSGKFVKVIGGGCA